MSNGNFLVNLGDLAKPAKVLIEKISNAVEGTVAPWQIRRMAAAERHASVVRAEAEKEVAVIRAQGDVEVADLHRRAANRWINEEARRQANMEDIVATALPLLNEDARPDRIEDDWIVNFFARNRIVSDKGMQALWARILAGKANSPGVYSKRTINILSDLDKSDADLFRSLCGFVWNLTDYPQPLVFDYKDPIYEKRGINFYDLEHLEAIGLIRFNTNSYWFKFEKAEDRVISYYGRPLKFDLSMPIDERINVGQVLFTKSGAELVRVCEGEIVTGFFEYARDHLARYLLIRE